MPRGRPQLGQGANLGLVDAWTLAQAVQATGEVASAITLFAERRSAVVRFYRQEAQVFSTSPAALREAVSPIRTARKGWGLDRLDLLPSPVPEAPGWDHGRLHHGRRPADQHAHGDRLGYHEQRGQRYGHIHRLRGLHQRNQLSVHGDRPGECHEQHGTGDQHPDEHRVRAQGCQ